MRFQNPLLIAGERVSGDNENACHSFILHALEIHLLVLGTITPDNGGSCAPQHLATVGYEKLRLVMKGTTDRGGNSVS